MKPILVCQFYPSEDAGYLADFFNKCQLSWSYLRIDQGEAVPSNIDSIGALVMMGGPMSVNDNLPWIPNILALIQQAQAASIPMLGHCLGGQLIAKALGAQVSLNPVREIGWGLVTPSDNAEALTYFGGSQSFNVFHWHGETFSLPQGSTHLLSSHYCDNQAFMLGNTLALQCHIEMTSDMVREWCIADAEYHAQGLVTSPAVESIEQMQADLDTKIQQLQHTATAVYQHWLKAYLQT